MIQVDENGIRRMLESVKNEKTADADISFGKDGLVLRVVAESLEEKLLSKIDPATWHLTGTRPNYENKTTEFLYLLPYPNLSVTSMLKDAIKSAGKNDRKGIRGSGIPIPSCPACQKPGKLKVMGEWVAVYHATGGGKNKNKPQNHAMTRYIKSLGLNPEEIRKKLIKVVQGEVKIENFTPSSGNLIIVENQGGEKVTSQDMGYYLKKLRESV